MTSPATFMLYCKSKVVGKLWRSVVFKKWFDESLSFSPCYHTTSEYNDTMDTNLNAYEMKGIYIKHPCRPFLNVSCDSWFDFRPYITPLPLTLLRNKTSQISSNPSHLTNFTTLSTFQVNRSWLMINRG